MLYSKMLKLKIGETPKRQTLKYITIESVVLTTYITRFKVKNSAFCQHKLFVILQKTVVISLHMLNGLPTTSPSCSAGGTNTPNFYLQFVFIYTCVFISSLESFKVY